MSSQELVLSKRQPAHLNNVRAIGLTSVYGNVNGSSLARELLYRIFVMIIERCFQLAETFLTRRLELKANPPRCSTPEPAEQSQILKKLEQRKRGQSFADTESEGASMDNTPSYETQDSSPRSKRYWGKPRWARRHSVRQAPETRGDLSCGPPVWAQALFVRHAD